MVKNLKSKESFKLLQEEKSSVLIDVRTDKEHRAVGIPNLEKIGKEVFLIEWKSSIFPWTKNLFLTEFNKIIRFSQDEKYLFICRSGIRSNFAALTVEESFNSGKYNSMFFNIEDGFEGHESPPGRFQEPSGWKNLNLPWKYFDKS